MQLLQPLSSMQHFSWCMIKKPQAFLLCHAALSLPLAVLIHPLQGEAFWLKAVKYCAIITVFAPVRTQRFCFSCVLMSIWWIHGSRPAANSLWYYKISHFTAVSDSLTGLLGPHSFLSRAVSVWKLFMALENRFLCFLQKDHPFLWVHVSLFLGCTVTCAWHPQSQT